jgi:hypothetical protein
MTSSQKQPKHDSYSSSTQKGTLSDTPAKRPYRSGANVHHGGAHKDPDGHVNMAEPNKSHHKR